MKQLEPTSRVRLTERDRELDIHVRVDRAPGSLRQHDERLWWWWLRAEREHSLGPDGELRPTRAVERDDDLGPGPRVGAHAWRRVDVHRRFRGYWGRLGVDRRTAHLVD